MGYARIVSWYSRKEKRQNLRAKMRIVYQVIISLSLILIIPLLIIASTILIFCDSLKKPILDYYEMEYRRNYWDRR